MFASPRLPRFASYVSRDAIVAWLALDHITLDASRVASGAGEAGALAARMFFFHVAGMYAEEAKSATRVRGSGFCNRVGPVQLHAHRTVR